jgi:phosphoserine aminotransferase
MTTQKHGRIFNFAAGPANLPTEVLEQVRDELLNYKSSGQSVMEMSHRSKEFDEILASAESLTKELMGLDEQHTVMFLQGGASLQFAMTPMNLYQSGKPVEVLHTGYWTQMAIDQLKNGFEYNVAASSEADKFAKIPTVSRNQINPNASYVHICTNNTIEGTQWKTIPDTGDIPLIGDMSSDILSRKLDFNKFGLIYAGAQKNLGPSGIVLAVIRKDLAERCSEKVPTMLQYRTHLKAGSRYNTPPTFALYICGLVMNWIKKNGGLSAMEKINEEKGSMLYGELDRTGFYKNPVDKNSRSLMNVVFRIKPGTSDSEKLEETFIKEAKKAGLSELKGHRAVGGIRASIYNAHPVEGVRTLVEFMREFEKKNG